MTENNNTRFGEEKYSEINSAEVNIENKSFFSELIDKVFKGDKVIWLVFVILCVISMIEIFSATSTIVYKQQNHWGPILRHSMFLLGGFGVIILMHNVPYRFFSSLIFLLLGSIVLLLLTPFIGETINGADRWIRVLGFTIQPSEFAKISLMGTVAFLLSKQNRSNEKTLFKWMIGLTAVVCGIIAIDNLSTALLLSLIVFLMMFIGNVRIIRLVLAVAIALAAVFLLLLMVKAMPEKAVQKVPILKRSETWANRLTDFSAPGDTIHENVYVVNDDNYQAAHAKIAIANGGLFGKFPGNSTERDFLPQAYSDFIYAIIIEEMGFLGGMFVLLLYVIILIRGGIIARKTNNLFAKYLVLGSALMLSIQAFLNMAVAVGAIPVTGQPLPLISRGGTSTLVTCAYFGIILSADRFGMKKKRKQQMQSFEDTDNNSENDKNQHLNSEKIETLEEKVDFTVIQV